MDKNNNIENTNIEETLEEIFNDYAEHILDDVDLSDTDIAASIASNPAPTGIVPRATSYPKLAYLSTPDFFFFVFFLIFIIVRKKIFF